MTKKTIVISIILALVLGWASGFFTGKATGIIVDITKANTRGELGFPEFNNLIKSINMEEAQITQDSSLVYKVCALTYGGSKDCTQAVNLPIKDLITHTNQYIPKEEE